MIEEHFPDSFFVEDEEVFYDHNRIVKIHIPIDEVVKFPIERLYKNKLVNVEISVSKRKSNGSIAGFDFYISGSIHFPLLENHEEAPLWFFSYSKKKIELGPSRGFYVMSL